MELVTDPKQNSFVQESNYINEILGAYMWHFRKVDKPCTFDELVTYANWLGLKNKVPTKRELIDFFLDQKICF